MSELSNQPVDNGERLHVETAFFTGLAGVRRTQQGGEFACVSTQQFQRSTQQFLRSAVGKVDGEPVKILSLRKSGTALGLLVAQFEYQKGDA
jgi:hypothetical protein